MVAELSAPATTPAHDTARMVALVLALVPDGLVAVAAKWPDRKGMDCCTFAMPGEASDLAAWTDARQGRANLYWMPNAPRATAARDRRCGEAAIGTVRAVWVDCDPRDKSGEDESGPHDSDGWRRAQARLDGIVQDLQRCAMPPTLVICSGYGRQALWWLDTPIDLEGLDDAARKAVVRSVQDQARGLEQHYASDGVHDLPRLLRLPFTVNLPDAGKQERGRIPSAATVISADGPKLRSLDGLAVVAPPLAGGKEAVAVDPRGLGDALSCLGLPESLPPALRAEVNAELAKGGAFHTAFMLDVVQGRRSHRDHAIVCACVEAGWSDPDIARVLCAFSSGKIEDVIDRAGDGAALARIAGEIARARAKTAPKVPFDPSQWLDHDAFARIAAADAARFKFITLDEAAAAAATDAAAPLIKGLLDQGAASVMYGASNTGKSFLAFSLAYAIATGQPWGGLKTTRMRTLIVAAEGSRGARKRAKALFRRFGSCPDFLLLLSSVNLFRAEADLEPLIRAILSAGGVGFVVLDTLARVMAGGDENQTKDMTAFVQNIGRLQAATGAHVMLIHHSGKNEANGARGSGALRAGIDTEIEIKNSTIKVTKQRDMDKEWTAPFRLEVVPLGVDRDGDPVTSCVVHIEQIADATRAFAAEPSSSIVVTKSEREIVDALFLLDATWTKPASVLSIADELEGADRSEKKKAVIRAHLNALRRKGSVIRVDKGKWALPSADSLSKPTLTLLDEFG